MSGLVERRGAARMWRRAVKGLAATTALLLLAAALFSMLGETWWAFDLFAHFRLPYLAAAATVALLVLTLSWRWAALVVIAALPHLYVVLEPVVVTPVARAETPAAPKIIAETGPSTIGSSTTGSSTTTPQPLRLVVYNVYVFNRDTEKFLDLIDREKPDIIVLQEFGRHWPAVLERLKGRYPHHVLGIVFGSDSAIVSRYPIRSSTVLASEKLIFPPLRVDIDVQGTTLRVIGVHTALPLSRYGYENQNLYLDLLAAEARRWRGPMIVAGDFNITHWSPRLGRFARAARLRRVAPTGLFPRTRYQPGLGPLTPIFGLPIDHVFVKGALRRTAAKVGPDIGSDHRPLIVDLEMGQRRERRQTGSKGR